MIEELPEGWSVADMGTVAAIRGGIQKQPKRAPKHNAFPYLRVANVLRGRLDLNQIEQMELFDDEPNVYCLEPGDILIVEGNGSLTEIGRSALWRGEIPNCVHQNHIIRVRPRLCIPSFLEYFWNSPLGISQVSAAAVTTSGLYSLSTKKVAAVRISIAPLPEQHRIVAAVEALLEKVARAKARLDRVAAILKRFRQAVLAAACSGELLGETGVVNGEYDFLPALPQDWTWQDAQSVCERVVDCHNKTAPYTHSGVILLRTTNIRGGRLLLDEVRFVTEETYRFWSRRCPPQPGDVLFTREAPMGEAAIIPEGMTVCMGQRMMLLRPNPKRILKEYLLLAVQAPHVTKYAEHVAVGSGVLHMRVGDVERLPIPVPPLSTQHEIVQRATAAIGLADAIEKRVQVARARAEKLPQAILSKAFSGELVATEAELARAEGRAYESAEELLRRVKGQASEATKAPRKRKQAAERKDSTPPAPSPPRVAAELKEERPGNSSPSAPPPAQPRKGGATLHSLPLGAQATLPGLEPEATPEVTTVGAALQERLAKGTAARLGLAPPVLSALLACKVEVVPNNPRATAKALSAAIPTLGLPLARKVADELAFSGGEATPAHMLKAARERPS